MRGCREKKGERESFSHANRKYNNFCLVELKHEGKGETQRKLTTFTPRTFPLLYSKKKGRIPRGLLHIDLFRKPHEFKEWNKTDELVPGSTDSSTRIDERRSYFFLSSKTYGYFERSQSSLSQSIKSVSSNFPFLLFS